MTLPPAPLTPAQHQELVQQIGQAAAAAVPPGWQQLRAVCRAAGRHLEVDVAAIAPDGRAYPAQPHPELPRLFGVLRTGMYQPGRGTWLSATLVFSPQQPPYADYQPDVEPHWRQVPPPIGFQDELRFFPREDRFVPPWLRQRAGLAPVPAPEAAVPADPAGLSGQAEPAGPSAAIPRETAADDEAAAMEPDAAPTATDTASAEESLQADAEVPAVEADSSAASVPGDAGATAEVRTPRVYDGLDEAGRPVVEREALSDEDREHVLAYLDNAPIILASRSNDTDAFDPSRTDAVPLTFRTDGSWVWPGAVAYYLREHGVSPDPELVAHIRAAGFAVPEVSDDAQDRALTAFTSPRTNPASPAEANPLPADAPSPADDPAETAPADAAPPANGPTETAPLGTTSPARSAPPAGSSGEAPGEAAPVEVAPAATTPAASVGEPEQKSPAEARPGPISPAEQDELLATIALALTETAPDGWQRILFDFMAIGRHANLSCGALLADGSTQQISVPRELSTPLAQLRRGMYVPNRGTWYTLSLVVDPPLTYRASFNEDDEPEFRTPPAQEHYVLDQERFPRDEDYLPLWFSARL
ncbi:hypothetical protein [Amycolatopsis benzoatilytica]|uniref:hypothetical protein n=1 Tax=Amycolatopsis benzoatilytica TaxID=346045 RepID=UPI00037ABB77